MSSVPKRLIAISYENYARDYLRKLPLEHFMEATDQATQRAITLASLALVTAMRKDFHVFNELLVQYPLGGRKKRPGQVVPDNMVVLTDEPIMAEGSYNTPVEAVPPFWVMEYVSKGNKRKDYEDSFRKYEQDLKVPYYLIFYPETQDLTLYRHNGMKYVSVKPNERGRYAVLEVEIEVALLDGWVRFWHRGELLLLPAELQRGLVAAKKETTDQKRRADTQERRADTEKQRADTLEAEVARLRALLEQRPAEEQP